MSANSANVRVGVTGAVYTGPPTGVTAPTAVSSVLDTDLVDLGYVSEDGVTETRDRSSDTIKGWQNGDTVRETITEANLTYALVLIESKKEVIEAYYATTVSPVDGSFLVVPSATGGRHPWVLDVIDGLQRIRTWIPEGEITEVGDQVWANGEPIGYEMTLRAYPSPTLLDANGQPASAKKWYSQLIVPA